MRIPTMNCIGVEPVYFLKFRINQLTLVPREGSIIINIDILIVVFTEKVTALSIS